MRKLHFYQISTGIEFKFTLSAVDHKNTNEKYKFADFTWQTCWMFRISNEKIRFNSRKKIVKKNYFAPDKVGMWLQRVRWSNWNWFFKNIQHFYVDCERR